MMASFGNFGTLGEIRNDATHEMTKSKMSQNRRFLSTHVCTGRHGSKLIDFCKFLLVLQSFYLKVQSNLDKMDFMDQ